MTAEQRTNRPLAWPGQIFTQHFLWPKSHLFYFSVVTQFNTKQPRPIDEKSKSNTFTTALYRNSKQTACQTYYLYPLAKPNKKFVEIAHFVCWVCMLSVSVWSLFTHECNKLDLLPLINLFCCAYSFFSWICQQIWDNKFHLQVLLRIVFPCSESILLRIGVMLPFIELV